MNNTLFTEQHIEDILEYNIIDFDELQSTQEAARKRSVRKSLENILEQKRLREETDFI